ncbi:putative flavoprotein involved in K+ transport [Streptomyces zhaozhouensis]|uniref:Putative flavoprotein involved in K+ transport n=1 Tax=Streptomyces zhaozhouensis TaxID=1300267 RepID=A0A286DVF4_9ACTN|nr:NAD(P)-binding domain-containing protein [Streptomyces zhaozhouensis]SOD62651.1 putative flavoprotein involved in K+ transport [Streptomyces zhaozhouensis]
MEHVDLLVIGAGQSGLSTAAVAARTGWSRPLVLEAGGDTAGAWPSYYDSLTLFSPARYSALPGHPFPGDPDRYPTRDEVADYLRTVAKSLDADIRTHAPVTAVRPTSGDAFTVETGNGEQWSARAVVAASGAFTHPHSPDLPGRRSYAGRQLHSADYRSPVDFEGARVLVVGAGNSAIQIAADLAPLARVTLASRAPVRWMAQRVLGRDIHWWTRYTGLDIAPIRRQLARLPVSVLDDGTYRNALEKGGVDRREMFNALTEEGVIWADGTRETVDAVIWATGYRHRYPYLTGTPALDDRHRPLQRLGVSTTVPGLGYVGIEFQRGFASNSLRGAARDAKYVLTRLRRAAPRGRRPPSATSPADQEPSHEPPQRPRGRHRSDDVPPRRRGTDHLPGRDRRG